MSTVRATQWSNSNQFSTTRRLLGYHKDWIWVLYSEIAWREVLVQKFPHLPLGRIVGAQLERHNGQTPTNFPTPDGSLGRADKMT